MAVSKRWIWAAGIVVVLFALAYAGCKAVLNTFLGDVGALEAQLPKEIESARREGLAVEPRELFPNRPVPPDQNAAGILAVDLKAIEKLAPGRGPLSDAVNALHSGKADAGEVQTIRSTLASCRVPLDRIKSVSGRPFCDFGKDYSLGAYVQFPEFAQMKSATRLLGARALLSMREGKIQDGESSLDAAFALARFSGQEPVLIGSLVQIACSAIAHRNVRQILFENSREERILSSLDRVLARADSPIDIQLAFKGELVGGLSTIKNLKSMKELEMLSTGEETPRSVPMEFLAGHMRGAWQTRYIQFWRRVFSKLPKERTDYLGIARVLETETAAENSRSTIDYLMNKILLPIFEQGIIACAKERSDHALSSATLALFRYRNRHRAFPEKLEETGGRFIDALDGKPLRYKKTATGFILYRIGPDLKDDGGKEPKAGEAPGGPRDLVVTFP